MRRILAKAALSVALALGALSAAKAQTYPTRPITMVVPFSAGGGTDILARLLARELETVLQQPVVVDNRPGASGAVGAENVMRSTPDGYKLLFGTSSVLAIAPVLQGGASAHLINGFDPVSLVATTALVLAVSENSKIKTLKDYVAASKSAPLTYGTFGIGSTPHLLGELFAKTSGADLVHVPYKGAAQAINDVTGGHIESAFLTVTALAGNLKDHSIRGLAVADTERLAQFPDIPTFAQAGYPGLDDGGWFAIFVPKGLPAEIRDTLSKALAKVLTSEKVAREFLTVGMTAQFSTPEQLQERWDASVKMVRNIKATTNIDMSK
jgi:tripartite-type tricarboxylate transporter receptor subunit TctC